MEYISTETAPAAIGPYSQAIRDGDMIFASGQIPLGLDGKIVEGGIEAQTKQVLANVAAILQSQDLSLSNVVKTTVFVQDLADFATINAIYEDAFGDHKPARSTIQVAGLPLGALVEIEVVATCS